MTIKSESTALVALLWPIVVLACRSQCLNKEDELTLNHLMRQATLHRQTQQS